MGRQNLESLVEAGRISRSTYQYLQRVLSENPGGLGAEAGPRRAADRPAHREADPEKAFYFYMDLGAPLGERALDLEDFRRKLLTVPLESLRFHQRRGDFARWIRDVFQEDALADALERVDGSHPDLRRALLEAAAPR